MNTKRIEKNIEKFFIVANEVQRRAFRFGQENFYKALEQEINIRKLLSDSFEDGLTLLGKGIVIGRKASETFAAGTHRKSNRLSKIIADPNLATTSKTTESKNFLIKSKGAKKSHKNVDSKPSAFKKAVPRNKKPRSHTGPVARSH